MTSPLLTFQTMRNVNNVVIVISVNLCKPYTMATNLCDGIISFKNVKTRIG